MKIKNIMFSGFAAAILMGTASASAVTFNVASKDYVDNLVGANGSITQAVSGLNEEVYGDPTDDNDNGLVGDVASLNEQINGNGTTTDGLAGDVSDLQNTVGDGQLANGFSNGVNDLTEAVNDLQSTKQDKSDSNVTTAGRYISTGTGVATNLGALDTAISGVSNIVSGDPSNSTDNGLVGRVTQLESDVSNLPTSSTVSALNTAVNGDPTDPNDNGLVGDVSALENKVGDGQLASGFSSGVDNLTEAVNDLQSTKANAADVYTKSEVNTLMDGKLNVPEDTCSPTIAAGESAWCALVSDGSGNLKWAKITAPFAVE